MSILCREAAKICRGKGRGLRRAGGGEKVEEDPGLITAGKQAHINNNTKKILYIL
jgi:hypothetical protein